MIPNFGGRGDDGLLQRFQLAVWPDGAGPGRNVDRWPDAAARARAVEIFQRLNTLEPGAVGAEDLTPEELPFLYRRAKRSRSFLPETRKSRNPTPRRFNVWRMLKRTR